MEGASRPCFVVAEPFEPAALARLECVGRVCILPDTSPRSLIAAMPEADALLIRAKAHVTARIIDAAPRLKVIGRAGPSLDHIDLRAARCRNIPVVFTPEICIQSTAEFALAVILALVRRLVQTDRRMREGEFESLRVPTGREMRGCTLALLGADAVADRLARICHAAFGCPVIYHDPDGGRLDAAPAEHVELNELLARADVLSLHLAAAAHGCCILNRERLALMRPTAIVVNTSRGSLVDTVALADALKTRRLAAAALDVYETEPLPMTHALRTAPNCILTPHVAAISEDAFRARFDVVDDVLRVLRGETPRFAVPQP